MEERAWGEGADRPEEGGGQAEAGRGRRQRREGQKGGKWAGEQPGQEKKPEGWLGRSSGLELKGGK